MTFLRIFVTEDYWRSNVHENYFLITAITAFTAARCFLSKRTPMKGDPELEDFVVSEIVDDLSILPSEPLKAHSV